MRWTYALLFTTLFACESPSAPPGGSAPKPGGSAKPAASAGTKSSVAPAAFAQELAGTSIKVNAACPGYTATDFNDNTGTRTVEQAAREPVRLALLGPEGPTGTFSNEEGPLPW